MATFKKIRSITASVLKLREGQPRVLALLSPFYVGPIVENGKIPATCCHVTDMETGETGILLVPAAMRNEVLNAYGPAGFVGKCFEVVQTKKGETGKFHHVAVTEVDPGDVSVPPLVPIDDDTIVVTAAFRQGEPTPSGAWADVRIEAEAKAKAKVKRAA